MHSLEKVQRLATRLIPSLRSLDYAERYRSLDLFSIAYRRVRGDMILVFQTLRLGRFPDLRSLFMVEDRTVLRGHTLHLRTPVTRLPHQYRLSTRVVKLWNALPAEAVESSSLAVFKQQLDLALWNNREDIFNRRLHLPGYPAGW